jgi:hypothetical protein
MSFVDSIRFCSNKLGLSIRLGVLGNKLLRWLGLLHGLEDRPQTTASADSLREAIPLEVSLRELGAIVELSSSLTRRRYYSRSSAQQAGMINSSASQPSYIGSDYTTLIGSTQAAGRPSVRISTQRSWTHGLFIGDFNHSPAGICGTWPACESHVSCAAHHAEAQQFGHSDRIGHTMEKLISWKAQI